MMIVSSPGFGLVTSQEYKIPVLKAYFVNILCIHQNTGQFLGYMQLLRVELWVEISWKNQLCCSIVREKNAKRVETSLMRSEGSRMVIFFYKIVG